MKLYVWPKDSPDIRGITGSRWTATQNLKKVYKRRRPPSIFENSNNAQWCAVNAAQGVTPQACEVHSSLSSLPFADDNAPGKLMNAVNPAACNVTQTSCHTRRSE